MAALLQPTRKESVAGATQLDKAGPEMPALVLFLAALEYFVFFLSVLNTSWFFLAFTLIKSLPDEWINLSAFLPVTLVLFEFIPLMLTLTFLFGRIPEVSSLRF